MAVSGATNFLGFPRAGRHFCPRGGGVGKNFGTTMGARRPGSERGERGPRGRLSRFKTTSKDCYLSGQKKKTIPTPQFLSGEVLLGICFGPEFAGLRPKSYAGVRRGQAQLLSLPSYSNPMIFMGNFRVLADRQGFYRPKDVKNSGGTKVGVARYQATVGDLGPGGHWWVCGKKKKRPLNYRVGST